MANSSFNAFQVAEAKIATASREHSVSLDLRADEVGRFDDLPESLGKLTRLKDLSLRGNQLKTLPAWLGNLERLEVLNLDGNQLTALPEWLGSLLS